MKILICITEFNYISKYINYLLYIHITYDMEKSENSTNVAKCTNVAYISASVNIVKISILIVSRQRHSSWNRLHAAALNALEVLKLYVTALRENVCGRELNESFKLIHEPIHWFANCFDQAFEQYLLKIMNYLWMDITHYPEKRHVLNKFKHL